MQIEIKIDGKVYELAEKKEEVIRVPEGIRISDKADSVLGYGLAIGNTRELFWDYMDDCWKVIRFNHPIPAKLTPCKREDLKLGDLAFRNEEKEPNFNKLSKYCLIINNEEYISIDAKDMPVKENYFWKYWWKVEKV